MVKLGQTAFTRIPYLACCERERERERGGEREREGGREKEREREVGERKKER